MSKVITLPSGNTATIRDPKTLLMKDRNKVMALVGEEENQVMQSVATQNGLISVMVQDWSFNLVPPSIRIVSLEELSPADYDALVAEALVAQEFLFPNFSEVPAGDTDPKVTPADSNA